MMTDGEVPQLCGGRGPHDLARVGPCRDLVFRPLSQKLQRGADAPHDKARQSGVRLHGAQFFQQPRSETRHLEDKENMLMNRSV